MDKPMQRKVKAAPSGSMTKASQFHVQFASVNEFFNTVLEALEVKTKL